MHSLPIRLFVSVLLCGVSAAFSTALMAGQKVEIYSAETLVKSQSEKERDAAARATIGALIVRISGQRSALDNPAVKAAMSKAQSYLFGFSYKSSNERISDNNKTYPAVALQLNYEPMAIGQLLRQAQLPLWPAIRPKLLIWLVAKDQSGLHLVPELIDLQALQAQAQYRGLPLDLPKLDLEDSLSLSADDLWRLNLEKIKAASVRYKPDAILIGRYTPYNLGPIPAAIVVDETAIDAVSEDELVDAAAAGFAVRASVASEPGAAASLAQSQGPWLGDWLLIHADTEQYFADEAPEVKDLFGLAIDRTADQFANQYAIVPTDTGPQSIVLRISGITNFSAFKEVQAYLGELAMVQKVELVKVSPVGMLVRLTAEGDVKLLMNTLALGHRLAPLESDTMVVHPSSTALIATEASVDETSTTVASMTDDAALDAEIKAEFDRALTKDAVANGPVNAAEATTPELRAPVYGGTVDNPLMYVWQR